MNIFVKIGLVILLAMILAIPVTIFMEATPKEVSATNQSVNGGLWLHGTDMMTIDLVKADQQGISNIYLHSYAVDKYGQTEVENFIKRAKNNNIRVHIWVQCFQENDKWYSPTNPFDTQQRLSKIQRYTNINGIDGIMLDYIRYNGKNPNETNDRAVTDFVKKVRTITNNANVELALCVMPETTNNIKYYGQNIPELSKHCDLIAPMVYKGNYNTAIEKEYSGNYKEWIKQTTKWFVDNSECPVAPILQTYVSDSDLNYVGFDELYDDIQASFDGGANGVSLFRHGFIEVLQ
jgi:hypothetical protein